MKHRRILTVCCLLGAAGLCKAAPLPVLDDRPVLQVDAGGPSAAVTALAFSPDGDTLYVGGLDKVVRVWHRGTNGFELGKAFRVPLGPGTAGAVNAIAVSPDGKWLAIAGRAPVRGEMGFQRSGLIVEAAALTPEQLEDAGLIYVASTVDRESGKVLRGHRGEVRALAFAQGQSDKPPVLVSTATEREGARRYGGLRLWDLKTGKQLAELTDLPARPEPPPGLVAWHTGPKPDDVRVAVSWPADKDEQKVSLRIWDPSAGAAKRVSEYDADRFTRPLALISAPGTPQLLVGGLKSEPDEAEQGRLQIWKLGAKVTAQTVIPFDAGGPSTVHFLPDGLAPVSAGADGKTRYAAVLLRPTAYADHHLAIVDLESNEKVADVPLAKPDRVHLPVLAASPRGRFVAVADAADHSVQIYAVADLIQGKAKLVQNLASNALTPRRVAFVDKGRGLWLSDNYEAKPLEGGFSFDFEKRRLEVNSGKAIADTPLPGEWTWKFDKDRNALRVSQGNKSFPPILLKDREVVTAVALRPATADRSALLAVAFTDRDNARTLIMLCQCEDGMPFRLLIGHLQDVRQLAFSASRPLLASVAEDQTVCVWSLKDLDQAVGQVQGLGIAEVDGKAVIHAVEPGSVAAKAGLAKGDVIEAVGGAGGELHDVQDAKDFLVAIGARRPGAKVQVKLSGKRDPVTLVVGRGVDGRKPLFSLLLHREPGGPGWVGWSPAGPYDASGDAAEACVGWHTNTGNANVPVAFVQASEHRKEYFKPGLLGRLAEKGDLAAAKEPDPPPVEPVLQPRRPDKAQYTKLDNVYLIREAVPPLQVGINADYLVTDAHVLKWSVRRADGGKVTNAEVEASGTARRDGDEWQADLKAVRWERGDYVVRFSLQPAADAKIVATESVTIRFQPSRPTLQLDEKLVGTTEQKPLTVMDDKLPVQVELGTASQQKVDLSFGQTVNGKEQDASKPLQVIAGKHGHQFTLAKGLNRISARAVNVGAGNDVEQAETAVTAVWVLYQAPVELPPRFAVLKLDRTPERGTVDQKDVLIVDRSHVRLDVRIEAAGPLVQADWAKSRAEPTPVPTQDAGKALDYHIDFDLPPGEVVPLRLRAKSKNSDVSFADLAIIFRPPLPALAADPLKSPDCLQSQFTLTGTYKSATADAFKLQVHVTAEQGQAKRFEAEVDQEKKTWNAVLTLMPGRNNVEAFVRNDWRAEEAAPGMTLMIHYRRPPRIIEAKGLKAVGTAVVDLPLTVESPIDMPLRAVTVEGHRFTAFKATKGAEKDGWITWSVVVPQVPVCDDGRKLESLQVLAHNDDEPLAGEQLVQATVVHVTHEELPKPADVRILLANSLVERRPRFAVPFRVESESVLVSAELRRDDEVLYRADLKASRKEGTHFVLEDKPEVPLKSGLNNLRLVVVNAGGQSAEVVVVNLLPPSVRVDLDRIERRSETDGTAIALEKRTGPEDQLQFLKAPGSLVWLVGHVTWSDPEAKQLDATDLSVAVLVRKCRQFPVALGPRGKGEDAAVRRFEVPIVLTGAENEVRVEVKQGRIEADRSVGQESLSRGVCTVFCAAPPPGQRLHLLIVGATATDSEALAQRVLDTLGATDRPAGLQGDFKKKGFELCKLYRVLVGEQVEKGKVSAQLVEINKEIADLRRRTKYLNDVILIYYQGEDVVKVGERWLKSHSNFQYRDAPLESYGIPCRTLQCVAGAQLLLLNVSGAPTERAAGPGWGGDPESGLLRYASAPGTPDKSSLVLDVLQRAMRERALLGDVAALVVDLLKDQPQRPDTQVAIKGLTDRIFGVPRQGTP